MKLRVYADRAHYSEPHRKSLNDILKAHWNTATPSERAVTYGKRAELFECVETAEAADLHLLPMKWQHYVDNGRVDQAVNAVEVARRVRRPIAVFSAGDFEANFPFDEKGVHLFQVSGYRSRRVSGNHGMPAFFDDPLASACAGEVMIRDKGLRPIVGFCGQAGASLPRHAARVVRNRANHLLWKLGRLRWEPPPMEHTWFRQRVIDKFSRSTAVETKFVLRTKYRAGISHSDTRNDLAERSRREFVDNVLGSDYTISLRGGGNFSVRFYEALALGRIPAFVDTDCVLPFHDRIDWRRYTVWIEAHQANLAPQLVADFHARLTPAEFRERQLECRKLWVERLSPDGFYAHFHEHFPEIQR